MQFFKGDAQEQKFYSAGAVILNAISASKDDFFTGAYDCVLLGELLYDNHRAPLSSTILRDVFIYSFNELFSQFQYGGNFESYLNIFKKVFGPQVDVQFYVTAPGKLQIDITVAGFDLDLIELTGTYAGDTLITQTGSFDIITKNRRDIDLTKLVARRIVAGSYVFDDLVDYHGDNIGAQVLLGFSSQYDLEQMLFEVVPAGIFTIINLTLS